MEVARPGVLAAALLLAAAGAPGCTLTRSWTAPSLPPPPAPAAAVEVRLLLVGDAGAPDRDGEPVLEALRAEAARMPGRTLVVFLGDNVYPAGIPAEEDVGHADALRRLDAQVDAVLDAGAWGIFLAGNHDWMAGEEGIGRQRARILERGRGKLGWGSMPGIEGRDIGWFGEHLRLVLLDTEAALRAGGEDPLGRRAVLDGLGDPALRGGPLVILGHHPARTHGGHGGVFSLRQHLFPVTDAAPWAWVPLPVLGSLYPLARNAGVHPADLANGRYSAMRSRLEALLEDCHPALYAAGHEHSLQVLRDDGGVVHAVSGAGSTAKTTPVAAGDDTLFASPCPGFMALDVHGDGTAVLRVIEVEGGEVREAFRMAVE